jgi:hypothetical protein
MTTNIQLFEMAKHNDVPLDHIIYKDEVNKLPKNKELYIIMNMSSSNHPGTHWTSFYSNPKYVIYADSFGVEPPQELIDWAAGRKLIYSDIQTEELDGINCGQLALNFLRLISKNLRDSTL